MKIDVSKRIFGLDVMRAVAILLVLFSHTSLLMYPESDSTVLTMIRFFGAIGVDVFFVLSGFLIGGILLKQINNGKTSRNDMIYFLIRRWLRTLPNYYLILLVNIILIFVLHQDRIDGIPPFFLFLQNFTSGQIDFFTESWSLSIEEFAYIVGPFLLLVAFIIFRKTNKHKLFVWVVLFILLLSAMLRVIFHINEEIIDYSYWSQNLRKVVIYRIDSIYYGFVAVIIASKNKELWQNFRFISLLIGVVLFLVMHGLIFKFDLLPENAALFYNVFYLPLVSISIAFFLPVLSLWKKGSLFKNTVKWISLLSYSLYLINYSIVLLTIKKYVDIDSLQTGGKLLMAVFFLGVSAILSYALFRWFELPIMNLRDKPFIKDKFKDN